MVLVKMYTAFVSSPEGLVSCRRIGAMLSPNYLDPDIRRELVRRGDAACTDPALIQARNNANLQGLKLGAEMMKQSGPQALPPGAYRANTPQKKFVCIIQPHEAWRPAITSQQVDNAPITAVLAFLDRAFRLTSTVWI